MIEIQESMALVIFLNLAVHKNSRIMLPSVYFYRSIHSTRKFALFAKFYAKNNNKLNRYFYSIIISQGAFCGKPFFLHKNQQYKLILVVSSLDGAGCVYLVYKSSLCICPHVFNSYPPILSPSLSTGGYCL